MRIEWNITKKRGNLRPTLTYSVMLEDHEKALALPPVVVESTIPEPLDAWQEHCYPGQAERAGQNSGNVYRLETPSHKGRTGQQSLRLPWREDNTYPEVEHSFALLRSAVEQELEKACASAPMSTQGSLQTSNSTKKTIAPGILAERFLAVANLRQSNS